MVPLGRASNRSPVLTECRTRRHGERKGDDSEPAVPFGSAGLHAESRLSHYSSVPGVAQMKSG